MHTDWLWLFTGKVESFGLIWREVNAFARKSGARKAPWLVQDGNDAFNKSQLPWSHAKVKMLPCSINEPYIRFLKQTTGSIALNIAIQSQMHSTLLYSLNWSPNLFQVKFGYLYVK